METGEHRNWTDQLVGYSLGTKRNAEILQPSITCESRLHHGKTNVFLKSYKENSEDK